MGWVFLCSQAHHTCITKDIRWQQSGLSKQSCFLLVKELLKEYNFAWPCSLWPCGDELGSCNGAKDWYHYLCPQIWGSACHEASLAERALCTCRPLMGSGRPGNAGCLDMDGSGFFWAESRHSVIHTTWVWEGTFWFNLVLCPRCSSAGWWVVTC